MADIAFGALYVLAPAANSGSPGASASGKLYVLAPSANSGPPGASSSGVLYVRDNLDGGAYRVTGLVTSAGVPAMRRVRLFDQISGRLVRETWSDADTGAYTFSLIRQGVWIVLAYDHTGTYDPEARADLVSEAI